MRCPRCAYKGKLFKGRCAVCGYPLEEASQDDTERTPAATQQPFLQSSDQYSPATSRQYAMALNPLPTNNQLQLQTLRAGDTLRRGRYHLLNQITLPISQQNQGSAWYAHDLQMSSRTVVLHEIKIANELGSTPNQQNYAANVIAQRLNKLGEQPGLPRIVDLFSERAMYFLVLLYPEGESLADLLKRWSHGLSEYTAAEYGWQLCEVLNILAQQQPPIVHGSISPETILISKDGTQAILMHLPLLPPKEPAAKTGDIALGYRAPEQQIHASITPSSDLYALAATLYHVVTGSSPHERPAAFYPPVRRVNPEISPAMELILARQLRLTVGQRYSNPYEMQQDLAALIESYPTQASKAVVQDFEMPLLSLQEDKSIAKMHGDMKRIIVLVLVGVMVLIGVILIAVLRS